MGTSNKLCPHCVGYRDHPHAYGDKAAFTEVGSASEGSSPRVWGQGDMFRISPWGYRIIPTRMGTSSSRTILHSLKRDHPHAYGDKRTGCVQKIPLPGSSPRVWGQASSVNIFPFERGIIPTRMGTRLKKSRKIAVLQNQPLRFPLTFHRSFV